jgi:alkyldihydroxyacetonephosphate synthase
MNFPSEMIRSELEEIVGEHFISVKETDKLVYSTDWSWMPQMWLPLGASYPGLPGTAEEIAEILLIANKYTIPVVPWGGGSGTQGGALPLFGGILVDMKRMDRIIEIDEKSLTVTAQAGINGQQLEWALNEKGLTLPHYAASSNCATLGGYLAPRGTGTISTKYGKAEDMFLRMQVVLPTGEIIRTAHVPKHAAGPDWARLWLGAEGTFGIGRRSMQVNTPARLLRGAVR